MMINEDMKAYMRMHPEWYLILSRYPQEISAFKEKYKIDNKMTFAHQIEKVGFMLQMLEMLL